MVTTVGAHHMRRPPRKRLELDPDFIVGRGAKDRARRAVRYRRSRRAGHARAGACRGRPLGSRQPDRRRRRAVGRHGGRLAPLVRSRLGRSGCWPTSRTCSRPRSRTPRRARTSQRLAGEQAALRRVATLVAREAPQADVFAAIAEEIRRLLGTEQIRMVRYEDEVAVVVGSSVAARGSSARRLSPPARRRQRHSRRCSAPGDPRASTTTAARRGRSRTPCGSPACVPRSGRRSPSKAACGAPSSRRRPATSRCRRTPRCDSGSSRS